MYHVYQCMMCLVFERYAAPQASEADIVDMIGLRCHAFRQIAK